jgi:uncharacterized protein (DUF1778 family)|tara:strand:- start:250 stop:441 length:192 start_codon:yes stop_codon:yes gene_type:complete
MSKSSTYTTRLSDEDRDTIDQASRMLGVKPSKFIREAAINQAEKMLDDPEVFVLEQLKRRMET